MGGGLSLQAITPTTPMPEEEELNAKFAELVVSSLTLITTAEGICGPHVVQAYYTPYVESLIKDVRKICAMCSALRSMEIQ